MSGNETKKTILVVDDDIDYLAQIKYQLEKAGYNVVTAEGQKAGEEALENLRPDFAVLDLMMENLDAGFSLSNHIKKKDPTIPVVIVTAVSSETGLTFDAATNEEKSWVKADALLNKPVRIEQLLHEIKKHLKE